LKEYNNIVIIQFTHTLLDNKIKKNVIYYYFINSLVILSISFEIGIKFT